MHHDLSIDTNGHVVAEGYVLQHTGLVALYTTCHCLTKVQLRPITLQRKGSSKSNSSYSDRRQGCHASGSAACPC